ARLLVDVRRAVHRETFAVRRKRNGPRDASAGTANRVDDLAHRLIEEAMIVGLEPDADLFVHSYSKIFVTTPAPTVRPPSRIAKRRPSSMAMGVMRSTFICTLSPGITISVPSGSVQ